MRSWIRVLTGRHDAAGATTRKTIDVAAVKAEAETLVGQIRANLARLEGVVSALPEPGSRSGDNVGYGGN